MPLGALNRVLAGVFLSSLAILLLAGTALAQFSPGDLSKAHQQLDGSENCTKCHEVGKEISGAKCLGCHEEIAVLRDHQKGYHGAIMSKQCVECHKEHLGKNAKTLRFDEKTFSHAQTGFGLDGKHQTVSCLQCHAANNIKDAVVLRKISSYPHTTYLGLATECSSCHRDPHGGKFKQECSSCHTTEGWPVKKYDHSKARFTLEGKHTTVACAKCHPGVASAAKNGSVSFAAKPFADCAPCHGYPHKATMAEKECKSCHTPDGWNGAMARPYNHAATGYPLAGRHASLHCEQCHAGTAARAFAQRFLLPHDRCTDCHADKHHGEFLASYKNDCASCHNMQGFTPPLFTGVRHAATRFPLTGAHAAVQCSRCHYVAEKKIAVHHFASLRCETCHEDVHHGEYVQAMKDSSCGACHTTIQWPKAVFDHASVNFPLIGRHAEISCAKCHAELAEKTAKVQKLSTQCQSCHADVHRGQFAAGDATDCSRCHNPAGWKRLAFDHQTQSAFPLTGAHAKVPCSGCHRTEGTGVAVFIRFKPLEKECTACHVQRSRQ